MEDYKQKYEHALKSAIAKINTYTHLGNASVVKSIYEIFPELKESEDEQHRKWILEFLYDGLRKSDEHIGISVVNDLLEKLKTVCGHRAIRFVDKQIKQINENKSYIEI